MSHSDVPNTWKDGPEGVPKLTTWAMLALRTVPHIQLDQVSAWSAFTLVIFDSALGKSAVGWTVYCAHGLDWGFRPSRCIGP